MRKATFDLLDSSLSSAYNKRRSYEGLVRFNLYRQEFLCDPGSWDKFLPVCKKHKLDWVEYKYSTQKNLNSEIKTKDPGVYIFFIRPKELIHVFPQFALYVGISNEGGSDRPLRERLKDYHNFNKIRKRENIHLMLELYYQDVWVVYSLLPAVSSKEIEALEVGLHGFLHPPVGRRDFPVEIKKSQRAFGKI